MGRHREGPVFLPTSNANIRAAPIVNTKHENRIQLWEYLTQTFAPIVSILIQFYMTLEFVYGIVKMSSYRRYVCLMLYFAYISCLRLFCTSLETSVSKSLNCWSILFKHFEGANLDARIERSLSQQLFYNYDDQATFAKSRWYIYRPVFFNRNAFL